MFQRGYLRIGSIRGAPVLLHWTLPLGAVLLGGLRFAPVFWVAFLVLMLAHELGHALMVRAARQRVVSVEVTGIGGLCHWAGYPTPLARAAIAWGGVLGQALVLLVALVAWQWLGPVAGPVAFELKEALVRYNLALMGLNLLPVAPFDGAEAWTLFRHLRDRWRRSRHKGRGTGRSWQRGSRLRLVSGIKDWLYRRRGRRVLREVLGGELAHPGPKQDRALSRREFADRLREISEQARRARRDN